MLDTRTLLVVAVGLLPGFEPRYLVLAGYPLLGDSVLVYAVVEVFVLAIALTILVDRAWMLFEHIASRSRIVGRLYSSIDARRRSVYRLVERWGFIGLAAFVAIPLPATGMYTGAAAALLAGIRGGRLAASLIIGGLASIAIVYAGVRGLLALAP